MLLVMRHGEADNNVQNRYNADMQNCAYKEAHLTEKGKAQVHAAAQELQAHNFTKETIAGAYVSPLPRTIETAKILLENNIIAGFIIDDRLKEVNMGAREGHCYNEFLDDPWDHQRAASYQGETDVQVTERLKSLLTDVRNKFPTETILFVTHGTPIACLAEMCSHEKIQIGLAQWIVLDC